MCRDTVYSYSLSTISSTFYQINLLISVKVVKKTNETLILLSQKCMF